LAGSVYGSQIKPFTRSREKGVMAKVERSELVSQGVNISVVDMDRIKVLARGMDRSISWVIRDLINESLGNREQEIEEYREQFEQEEAEVAAIKARTSQQPAVDIPPTPQQSPTITFPSSTDVSPSSTIDSEKVEVAGDLA
jgi:Ribbon-helix-helix protein, copG family